MTKYGSKKVEFDGIKFDSKMEADFYKHLLELKEQGTVVDFTLQPVFELIPKFVVNGKKRLASKYKADFLVRYVDGSEEIIDVKGFETTDFKLKKKLFEYRYSKEIICISFSKMDGGWIMLEDLKKARAARRKAKKSKKKD